MSRTILVTGCSSGIGHYCAHRLRDAGWQVFATARRPQDLAALEAAGLTAVHLDYGDETTVRAAAERLLSDTGGRIDALFNNGGYAQPGAVEDLPTGALRAQFESNVFGWHTLTQALVPAMRRRGQGRIVHCSSILGFLPYRWRGAYIASKFALEGLFLSQRLELAGSGVHVSLIEPGPIATRFDQNALRHFLDNIDVDGSVHAEAYRRRLAQMRVGGGLNRFRLGPEAVYRSLDHALNSRRPRARYRVTVPSKVMAWVAALAPHGLMEKVLLRSD